ncbi:MAG: hypothetical protein FJW35_16215 [Acidobacteria bacterium]|nr:hypothetical protein [Acidobacteriota bacterium]
MPVVLVDVPKQAAFKVAAAARYLGLSANTLRKKTDLGLIPAHRDDAGARIYLLRDLDSYPNSLPPYLGGGSPLPCRPAEFGRKEKGGA